MGSRDPDLHERKLYMSKQEEKTLIIPSNLDRFDVSQELGDILETSHIISCNEGCSCMTFVLGMSITK